MPGLTHLALPGFVGVDDFYSRGHLANRIRAGLAPEGWLTNYWSGKVNQGQQNKIWTSAAKRRKERVDNPVPVRLRKLLGHGRFVVTRTRQPWPDGSKKKMFAKM